MNILSKIILYFLFLYQLAYGLGVAVGTKIENIAYLNYRVEDKNYTAVSNKLVDVVDQKLDMQIVCQESANIIVGVNEKKRALSFRLVNRGNGTDSYSLLTIGSEKSDFEVNNQEIYLDNGDNVFSISTDTLVTEINLSADENKTLFFVSDIPNDVDKFSHNGITISSEIQGSLLYGESKKLKNYYVVAASLSSGHSALCTYEVSKLLISLEKSATLSSDKLYHRSTIHYTIALIVEGTGEIENVVIQDIIPQGTEYINGTLALDGVNISDDTNGTTLVSVAFEKIIQKEESRTPKHYITFDVKVK